MKTLFCFLLFLSSASLLYGQQDERVVFESLILEDSLYSCLKIRISPSSPDDIEKIILKGTDYSGDDFFTSEVLVAPSGKFYIHQENNLYLFIPLTEGQFQLLESASVTIINKDGSSSEYIASIF